MFFESVSRTDIGRRRRLNEDAVLCRPDLGLWAVADGMGGHDCGEVASALVVEVLAEAGPDDDLAARTRAAQGALQAANTRLVELARSTPERRTIGTTVVLLAAEATAFSCLWAGDSRAYRARAGSLNRLTSDHSLVQQLVDAGLLDPAEAETHPNANVITRAVGADPALVLDSVHGDVVAGDVFLLASDGLTRLVSDQEILEGLAVHDLAAAADRFIAAALDRGAPDNVSLVMVRALA
jgi:serine/threonine protein phosphatase PrpC